MLNVVDHVWLSGGYEMDPDWLQGGDGYSATILGFKEFDLGRLVVARLDHKIRSHDVENDIILMQLIHENTVWEDKQHVRIFLCRGMPSTDEFVSEEWFSSNSAYVESHANYKKI